MSILWLILRFLMCRSLDVLACRIGIDIEPLDKFFYHAPAKLHNPKINLSTTLRSAMLRRRSRQFRAAVTAAGSHDYTARPSRFQSRIEPAPSVMEINPIKSEITALRARFDALRGYL